MTKWLLKYLKKINNNQYWLGFFSIPIVFDMILLAFFCTQLSLFVFSLDLEKNSNPIEIKRIQNICSISKYKKVRNLVLFYEMIKITTTKTSCIFVIRFGSKQVGSFALLMPVIILTFFSIYCCCCLSVYCKTMKSLDNIFF